MAFGAALRLTATFKPYLLLMVCIGALASLHLARPNRNPKMLRMNVGPLVYAYDLDTQLFVWLTLTFPKGLATEEGKIRRERPGYPALGWLAWQMLKPLRPLLPNVLTSRMQAGLAGVRNPRLWQDANAADLVMVWGGLMLVNLLTYWLAAALLYQAFSKDFDSAVAFGLSLLPITHFNSIDYLLVPHTEPFNVLLPALFVVALLRWRAKDSAVGLAAAFGLAMMVKSYPVPAGGWLLEAWRRRRQPRKAVLLGLGLGLIVVPGIAYYLLLLVLGIEPYSHSVASYRQVVWMVDAWHNNRSATIPTTILKGMGEHFLNILLTWWVILLSLGALFAWKVRRSKLLEPQVWMQLGTYFAVNLVFWGVVNFHSMRLAIVAFPPILYLLGVQVVRRAPNPALWMAGTIAAQLLAWSLGAFDSFETR